MKSVTSYPFSMGAGLTFALPAEGEYFRIQSSLGTVSVTVEGSGTLPDLQAGQGIKNTPFKRLVLKDTSGAANAGVILVASEEFIDNRTYGINDLSAGSLNIIRYPLQQTGYFSDTSTITANTPIQVFAPASNINGAILLDADIQASYNSASSDLAFLIKSSAPANIADGGVVLLAKFTGQFSTANFYAGTLAKEKWIPPGQGLYFMASGSVVSGTNNMRSARFRLL